MANVQHETLVTANLHPPGYVQGGDPGAVGAGKLWTDTSGGTGFWVTKMRNIANTGWEVIGISGYSGVTGLSGYSGVTGLNGVPGVSGYSGWSGNNPGTSGWSGYSGLSGFAGVSTYVVSFATGDIAPSGVLTVVHGLSTQYNCVQVYNDSNRLIIPDAVVLTDANSLTVDLSSYYPIANNWRCVVISGA